METIKRVSKQYYLRQVIIWLLVNMMFFGLPFGVLATPSGWDVKTAGNATVGQAGNTTTVNMLANQAVIDWQSLDTAPVEILEFVKASGGFAVLNRVISGSPTQFNGTLKGNQGWIFVVNPSGLVFGPTSSVSAAKFTASTMWMDLTQFMAENYQFTASNPLSISFGDVVNEGTIQAEQIHLLGRNVTNRGIIRATASTVIMAAGDQMLLAADGSNVMVQSIVDPANRVVDNGGNGDGTGPGQIDADNGNVILAAGDIYSTALDVGSLVADAEVGVSLNSVTADESINVNCTDGPVDVQGSLIAKDGDVKVTSGEVEALTITGDVSATNGDVELLANGGWPPASSHQGTLEVGGAITATGSDILLQGDDVHVGGPINADGKLTVEGRHDIILGSSATSNDNMILHADKNKEAGGDMIAHGDLTSSNGSIDIQGNAVYLGGDVSAEGGDLSILGRTSQDHETLEWGHVEVGPDKKLYSSEDITINDYQDSGMELIGSESLTLEAVGNIDADVAKVSGMKTFYATAGGWASFGGPIEAYAEASSDAVAGVWIDTGDTFVVEHDITAVAIGNAAENDNASATVSLVSHNGNVEIEAGPHEQLNVKAIAKDGLNNSSDIVLTAGEDVKVTSVGGGKAEVKAIAKNAENSNTSNVVVNAGCKVKIKAEGYGSGPASETEVMALAKDGVTNNADIDVTAKSIKVIGKDGGQAEVKAIAKDAESANTANINLTAEDGYVKVLGIGGFYGEGFTPSSALVKAKAEDAGECSSGTNTSNVTIIARDIVPADIDDDADSDCDGDVKVIGIRGGNAQVIADTAQGSENLSGVDVDADSDVKVLAIGYGSGPGSFASIKAKSKDGLVSNTSNITVTAGGDVKVKGLYGGDGKIPYAEIYAEADPTEALVRVDGPENVATIVVDAGRNVEVAGIDGDGSILAEAYNGRNNTADVQVDAGGDVDLLASGCLAEIRASAHGAYNENIASVALGGVGHKIGGNVKVKSEHGDAKIAAESCGFANKNSADVLICTEGYLDVQAGKLCGYNQEGTKNAEIKASSCFGAENSSNIGIGAEDGLFVKAFGEHSNASIASDSMFGYRNEADIIACTNGDLWVMATNGGNAEIASRAKFGFFTDAFTAACATGDVIVSAADYGNNQTRAAMGNGMGMPGGTYANISSEAASVGKGCGNDTTANADTRVVSKEGSVSLTAMGGFMGPAVKAGISSKASGAAFNTAYTGVAALTPPDLGSCMMGLLPGSVLLMGSYGGEARISSEAYGCGAVENEAKTVVCAADKVLVTGVAGGKARISSAALGAADDSAQTKVFADKIGLFGDGKLTAMTPGHYVSLDHMCITPEGKVALNDGSALIVIGDYDSAEDCPTCPPCPCEEQPGGLTPAAAIVREEHPESKNCPLLVQAATAELTGTSEAEAMDTLMENALALNPDINPCQTCGMLLDSAGILADPDGARMAALAAVVGSVVAPDQPFNPESELMIATAIAENVGNAENPEYAFAEEYIDALVNYVAAAEELGIPVADGTELVMAKYGTALQEPENANIMAYVQARLAALQ